MKLIDKSAVVTEIERRLSLISQNTNAYEEGRKRTYMAVLYLLDNFEVKEINNVWHNAKRTIPEDGNEQIICIKEDGLVVSTVGKIVNGTIKWAYLNDLLGTSSFNVEVKEVDLEKEVANWWNAYYSSKDYTFEGFTGHYLENSTLIEIVKHFYELGLNAKGE